MSDVRPHREPDLMTVAREAGALQPVALCGWLLAAIVLPAATLVSAGQVRSRSETGVARLAPGRLLVASRELADPNFRRTVVLLIDYGRREGAFGLVINRPSRIDLSQVLAGDPDSRELGPVFLGGPVEPLPVTLLMRGTESPEAAHRIFDDVHFSSSRELLEQLARQARPTADFRAYAGYAGWAIGQLEAEVSAGGWHVVDGRVSAVFDASPADVWPRLILIGTAEWARLGAPRREDPRDPAS